MITPWPFTGRSTQLEGLGRHFRDPDRAGVVLHGPAGVGKTRLAEEALRLAERGGRRVERAVGHPSTQQIPLGALAHLLPAGLTGGVGVGDDERTSLFHGARAELQRLAGDDRLVLHVDDLDLLDDTSVAVLVPLLVSRTVFLVGTVRTGRSPSDRLAGLHRDGYLERVEIAPLDDDEVGALLHRVLDGPVSSGAQRDFARLSGGNLQVLTELVRGALEAGVLAHEHDGWVLTGPLPTTTALDALVAEHVEGVAPAGRAVLDLLAVGGHLGLADLERSHGADTIESLEAAGLVTVTTTDRRTAVRLAHPIYGEVIRAGLPPLRLRRIQGELADLVEARGTRRREDLLQVAVWRVASGGRVPGARLAQAARLAVACHDPALAIQLMSAADEDDVNELERAEVLVEAHSMIDAPGEVERIVGAIWDTDLGDAARAHFAKRLAETRFYRERDLDGALAIHTEARGRITDPDVAATVDARRASLLAGAGRPADALAIIDAMPSVGSGRTRVEVAGARAVALINLGCFDEARTVARRAGAEHAEVATASGSTLSRRGIAQHLVNEAHALAYAGHYREARELLEPAVERARATNAWGAWVWLAMCLAEVARDTGRGHEAIQRFAEVAQAAPGAGQHAALVWAHVGVAQGHLLLGDCAEAAEALDRADRTGDSPVATSTATRDRARAWLAACRGDLTSARSLVRATLVPVREDRIHAFEITLLHDLVRLGVADEAVVRLEELATSTDGPLIAIHAAHARALVDRDTAAQHGVVDRYEQIDALALAAEAAAELADLHQAAADNRSANAARQRSAELAEQLGGLRTPVLARGSGFEPLTAREREVALLAREGRSSRDIGEHLGLSSRTVDTHLARVYRKLGIAGRGELAEALQP